MTDPETVRDFASVYDAFMAEVDSMNRSPDGLSLGERIEKIPPFARGDNFGLMLATFCAKLPGHERETNFAGMVTRLRVYRHEQQAWVRLDYADDKGPQRLKFLLSDFIRLLPFKREMNGYRFVINEQGVLVKEEIRSEENPKTATEAPHVAVEETSLVA